MPTFLPAAVYEVVTTSRGRQLEQSRPSGGCIAPSSKPSFPAACTAAHAT
jgi:hypothetical protein